MMVEVEMEVKVYMEAELELGEMEQCSARSILNASQEHPQLSRRRTSWGAALSPGALRYAGIVHATLIKGKPCCSPHSKALHPRAKPCTQPPKLHTLAPAHSTP